MHSERAQSIYVHTNPEAFSDHNDLQYSCNDDPKCDYVIHRISIFLPELYLD